MKLKSEHGFTLIELIIVMLIFITVIVLSSQAFERILTDAAQEGKKAESNIQGVVGLELMRTDLEHAGYALPWVLSGPAAFLEMDAAANPLAVGIDSTAFNDSALLVTIDAFKVPRAFQSGKSASTGMDYLVVKSVVAGFSTTAKKWAYVNYSVSSGTDSSYIKKWNSADDFTANNRVITLNSANRQLIVNGSTYFYTPTVSGTNPVMVASGFAPAMNTDIYLAYGVDTVDLRMPYNRADYYVKTPADMSQRCAPGTGNLYKATVNHSNGNVTQYPLLDCVADMQVVYSLDTNGDGAVDQHVDESGIFYLSAQDIRSQVKEVRVYILTHEGKADRNYSYPSQTVTVGEFGMGRNFDLATLPGIGTTWRNYRWKVYKMVVIPRNLSS